ncbi:TPA: transposase [Campylobacter coli]|nr:transposase [Campylobacter coli]
MNTFFKMRYHRDLPNTYKFNQITIIKNHNKYYLAFSIIYDESNVSLISSKDFDIKKAVDIDLNINEITLSSGELIATNSKLLSRAEYDLAFKRLQRKQSRRILKTKKEKTKLSHNFKKTQLKLNKIYEKSSNIKKDSYHKITSKLIQEFDLLAVEDLQIKNMSKRAKLKNIKAKSGLNKSILNISFYQFSQYLEYKAKHNGKFFIKVNPQYTSKTCSVCGNIKKNLMFKDRVYLCEKCGNTLHRDINAANNILKCGLKSFGLGISLEDYKLKAFRIS